MRLETVPEEMRRGAVVHSWLRGAVLLSLLSTSVGDQDPEGGGSVEHTVVAVIVEVSDIDDDGDGVVGAVTVGTTPKDLWGYASFVVCIVRGRAISRATGIAGFRLSTTVSSAFVGLGDSSSIFIGSYFNKSGTGVVREETLLTFVVVGVEPVTYAPCTSNGGRGVV